MPPKGRLRLPAAGGALPSDLFQVPRVVEASTVAFDPDKQGVGSSPYLGDAGNSVLFIPQAATLDMSTRYLFRLCGIAVPPTGKLKIMGLRQVLTIAQEIAVTVGDTSWTWVEEREVVSPLWSFVDGNVSWHLRVLRGADVSAKSFSASLAPGESQSVYGVDSALLSALASTATYNPSSGGLPPGEPVGGLGTFRDLRFPQISSQHADAFGYEVMGPAIVAFYASVRQTDPTTRPYLPSASLPADLSGWLPEARFLQSFGNPATPMAPNGNAVRYRHIGGTIVANVGPIDMPWGEIEDSLDPYDLGACAPPLDAPGPQGPPSE